MPKRFKIGKIKKPVSNKSKPGPKEFVKKIQPDLFDDLAEAREEYHKTLSRIHLALVERILRINSGKMAVRKIESQFVLYDLFVVLSFAYYRLDDPLVSDAVFDDLCKVCLEQAKKSDAIPALKSNVSKFKMGSGFDLDFDNIRGVNPQIVYNAYRALTPNRSIKSGDSETTKAEATSRPRRIIRRRV